MSPDEKNPSSAKETTAENEWTVMFLFASDNELAPLIVSQLKAIKDADFHQKVDVVVQFDPSAPGVATKLLHVNRRRKAVALGHARADHRERFVPNMDDDTVLPDEIKGSGEWSGKMREALKSSDRIPALAALDNFLGYCRENHPARNYALFLVGHGLVVGKNGFLPDQHPVSAVTLRDLGSVLRKFKAGDGTLQLLALHSCAMSAVEVAYELRGTARYMIGSEGVSYVGSYPYQKLLRKLFETLNTAESSPGSVVNVEELVEKLYLDSLHNAADFILTGYSLDLALCSLEPAKYEPLTEAIRVLVSRLKGALETDRGKELILLAHWESQSYWDENYTDLYDFCLCLERRCKSLYDLLVRYDKLLDNYEALREEVEYWKLRDGAERLDKLARACGDVRRLLSPNQSEYLTERFKPIVVRADNFGSKYQYSHGLSVYFPWSKPLDAEPPPPAPVAPRIKQRAPSTNGASNGASAHAASDAAANSVLDHYQTYAFSDYGLFGNDSWLSFLKSYFCKTQRAPRSKEEGAAEVEFGSGTHLSILFHAGALAKETGSYDGTKETGSYGSCSCPSIKNHPTEVVATKDKKKVVEVKEFSCTSAVRSQVG
ncbi:MAG TPA: clostripain-related cysteine peptidase [Pyrinomonadaceae bacterium]|nr:clostripain-related cysteine peptidase [Pyrinomonadaceae bacterium]